ncbi:hypothetical protein OAE12_00615 [bacterium]|nr:hypothetical protein [bacterium]
MKNITKFIVCFSIIFLSCEADKTSYDDDFLSTNAKGSKNKNESSTPELLKDCKVLNADRCELNGYSPASFWWPKEGEGGPQGLFSVGEDYEMSYLEYDDGTINIKGQTELNGCVVDVNLWLKDKKNLDEWTAGGGLFKDELASFSCADVVAELLNYYVVDETRSSMTASGCEERNGEYTISHRPVDERYAFQVGPGGALFDQGNDFGVSGWASAINKATGESHILDFNFVTECEVAGGGCDTAFARGENGDNCFIGNGFNRWGWTLGPLSEGDYSYEVYAGAGQCDIDKGQLAGTVDVSYLEGEVTVTYNIDPSFTVEETHTYASNDMFPTGNNGRSTVAPGQYTVGSNLSGDIYVIAHAVVCK